MKLAVKSSSPCSDVCYFNCCKFDYFVFVSPVSFSPINAPVSSSFAGGLRHINISSNLSESLVKRQLDSVNLTLSSDGVSFSGLLPVVRQRLNNIMKLSLHLKIITLYITSAIRA